MLASSWIESRTVPDCARRGASGSWASVETRTSGCVLRQKLRQRVLERNLSRTTLGIVGFRVISHEEMNEGDIRRIKVVPVLIPLILMGIFN